MNFGQWWIPHPVMGNNSGGTANGVPLSLILIVFSIFENESGYRYTCSDSATFTTALASESAISESSLYA